MRLRALGRLWPVLVAGTLSAQDAAPVYQKPSSNTRLRVDAVLRQEWTRDIWVSPDELKDEDRWHVEVRPRLEFGTEKFTVGVGGQFDYSSDINTETDNGEPAPLIRDNYKSRDARLDLAFARIEPVGWLRLEGGRFFMPVQVTEMIWDRDLRPQGGAVTLQARDANGVSRFSVTGLYANGSHVFEDDNVDMLMASAQATFPGAMDSSFQLVASYVEWRNINNLESPIRRQNTKVDGLLVKPYRVVDAIARISQGGNLPVQLVANMCWNTAVSENGRGLWLAAVLGGIKTSRLQAEYTFASIDKDATLAAYDADDFFWETGWKGQRVDLGSQTSDRTSIHVVGEIMRFKDSPDPEQRDHNVKRLRLELRVAY